jgi:plasmid stability protein
LKPFGRAEDSAMPVTLSVKNVPDAVARRLKARARRNHRSLQGELLALVEEAAEAPALSPKDVLGLVRRLGLATPAEAAKIVRAERDAR